MSNIEQSYAEAVSIGVQRDVVGAVGLAGKRAPLNPDGTSHFADCPDAGRFRRRP